MESHIYHDTTLSEVIFYTTIPWESRHRTMRPPPSLPGLVTEASPGASGLELWTRQWAPGNWAKGTNTTSPDTAVKLLFEERNAVVKHNFKKACF